LKNRSWREFGKETKNAKENKPKPEKRCRPGAKLQ